MSVGCLGGLGLSALNPTFEGLRVWGSGLVIHRSRLEYVFLEKNYVPFVSKSSLSSH